MNYFIFSFLVGGIFTLIPFTRNLLFVVQNIFYKDEVNIWLMFTIWGLISSLLFFTGKSFIEEHGFAKFWKFALITTLFLVVFVLFVTTN